MFSKYFQFAITDLLLLSKNYFADSAWGGFHEQLTQEGTPVPLGTKRLMVQCRQLYVLSHAALLGDNSGMLAAEAGYAFIRSNYLDHRNGGWFFRRSADGQPTHLEADSKKDAYTHAFLLFALAYLHRAFCAPGAIELAVSTYELLQRKLAADNGGFWDEASRTWEPLHGLRRQNPHMHLLEALHALYEATAQPVWLQEAEKIISLFRNHFYDASTTTLGEYFKDDWSSHPELGHIVEPGHHFEWVWLLHRHAALTGQPLEPAATGLFDMATAHGFDALSGGLLDQINRDGAPIDRNRRIWPITEAIKAHVACLEAGHPVSSIRLDNLVGQLWSDFIRPSELGWIERLTPDSVPAQSTLPGSTPYHLFLAATELWRVFGDK